VSTVHVEFSTGLPWQQLLQIDRAQTKSSPSVAIAINIKDLHRRRSIKKQGCCVAGQWTCDRPVGDRACVTIADMRSDVQDIFKMTPHDKQVMMFSATLSKEIRPICKKFMSDVSILRLACAAAMIPLLQPKTSFSAICSKPGWEMGISSYMSLQGSSTAWRQSATCPVGCV
jgi:hypothetical protein